MLTQNRPGVVRPVTTSRACPAWGALTESLRQENFGVSRLERVSADWAWGGADGTGIRVAILDSGVDGSHPMIPRLERSVGIVASEDGQFSVEDCEPVDTAGHGTACAGLISSIAPAAALTSVRVLTNGRNGTGAGLLAGLEWAIDQGFDVINLSLSTGKPQFCLALHDLADRAYFRRCVLVASAHNMPVPSFPWRFASVISVASHDEARFLRVLLQPVAAGGLLCPRNASRSGLARR